MPRINLLVQKINPCSSIKVGGQAYLISMGTPPRPKGPGGFGVGDMRVGPRRLPERFTRLDMLTGLGIEP